MRKALMLVGTVALALVLSPMTPASTAECQDHQECHDVALQVMNQTCTRCWWGAMRCEWAIVDLEAMDPEDDDAMTAALAALRTCQNALSKCSLCSRLASEELCDDEHWRDVASSSRERINGLLHRLFLYVIDIPLGGGGPL